MHRVTANRTGGLLAQGHPRFDFVSNPPAGGGCMAGQLVPSRGWLEPATSHTHNTHTAYTGTWGLPTYITATLCTLVLVLVWIWGYCVGRAHRRPIVRPAGQKLGEVLRASLKARRRQAHNGEVVSPVREGPAL